MSNIPWSYIISSNGVGAKLHPNVMGLYSLMKFEDECGGNDNLIVYKHIERNVFLYNATDRWIVGDKENNEFLHSESSSMLVPEDGWSFSARSSTKGQFFQNDTSIKVTPKSKMLFIIKL